MLLAIQPVPTIRSAAPTVLLRPGEDLANHEANHRIANSLQLVSALLSSQRREVEDPAARQALEMSVHRIAAIAGVHRQLHLSGGSEGVDVSTYLVDLVEGLQHGFCCSPQHRRIDLQVDRARVSGEFATMLGIVVTELVINACKHAYAPDEPGSIGVSMEIGPSRSFSLEVRDDGVGGAAPAGAGRGLGSRIIHLMSKRLNVDGRYVERARGTAYLMTGLLPAV